MFSCGVGMMPTLPRLAVVCCVVVSALPRSIDADEIPGPALGSRVRLHSASLKTGSLEGTLAAIDPGSLTVIPEDDEDPRVVARQDISRLEWRARPSRKTTGALVGFTASLAVLFFKVVAQGGCNDGCDGSNLAEAGLVALSGAAVGALLAPGERWEDATLGRVRSRPATSAETGPEITVVPQLGRGVGLTIVASF